jgi:lipoprotein-anchoring transpeptidase ErfK/SrfK
VSGFRRFAIGALSASVAGLMAAGVIGLGTIRRGPGPVATARLATVAARPHPAAAPKPPPAPGPAPSLIATLREAVLYRASPGGTPAGTLAVKDPFGIPQVLAVIGAEGSGVGAWLRVELPIRPNGSTGWIPASAATLTKTYYRVDVSLAARSLTVSYAGRPVLTTPVAVGSPRTPTPPDRTYLWELLRPEDPSGPYGPYIFGLAEYSDAYSVFNGGDAQIGIHGQDEPWSIGLAASNGCVRLPNATITRLAGMLPLGTPVTIS